jgi:hypothetical protein
MYRYDGIGPAFVLFGKTVRYRLSDIKLWRDSHLCNPGRKEKQRHAIFSLDFNFFCPADCQSNRREPLYSHQNERKNYVSKMFIF